jgi:hypothetical protein
MKTTETYNTLSLCYKIAKIDDLFLSIDDIKYFYTERNDILFINKADNNKSTIKTITLLKNAIENLNADKSNNTQIIIAIQDGELGFKYGIINYNNINSLGQINAHEVIVDIEPFFSNYGRYYKFYLDIDVSIISNDEIPKIDVIVNKMIVKILDFFKDFLNIGLTNNDIFVNIAHRKGKYSIHLIFNIFSTEILSNYIIFTLLQLDRFKYNNIPIVDASVYIKNQNKIFSIRNLYLNFLFLSHFFLINFNFIQLKWI